MAEINFRQAEAGDLAALVSMMREFNEHERINFDEAEVRAALTRLLDDESLGRVWLIESAGAAAGYLVLTFGYSLEFRGRDAFVDELFVGSQFRGLGLGRRALEFAEEACRSLGIRALHLEVERSNVWAQSLYRKAGFEDHDRYLLTKWVGQ